MPEKKVICWDLDSTLGYFEILRCEFMGGRPYESEGPLSLRYGIVELLSDLSSQGYTHFVTTEGHFEYARQALMRTGLIEHFQEIFGGDVIKTLDGKRYKPVADAMGLSDEEAVSNMIVIGDAPGDIPVDLEGLVFIQHERCFRTDSYITRRILERLSEFGHGDFKNGFDMMFKSADVERVGRPLQRELRTFQIDNGIKVELEYQAFGFLNNEKRIVPTIGNIEARDYFRKPVPLLS